MKPKNPLPIYYTDGTSFYRTYKGIRTQRDETGKWVEMPCYVKPVYWEISPDEVDDPEFPR